MSVKFEMEMYEGKETGFLIVGESRFQYFGKASESENIEFGADYYFELKESEGYYTLEEIGQCILNDMPENVCIGIIFKNAIYKQFNHFMFCRSDSILKFEGTLNFNEDDVRMKATSEGGIESLREELSSKLDSWVRVSSIAHADVMGGYFGFKGEYKHTEVSLITLLDYLSNRVLEIDSLK